MTTLDQIIALKPGSIFDVVPEKVFIERDDPEHGPYIRSGNYYEWKYAVAKFLQPRSILEIGVRYGYSLATFCAACRPIHVEGWDNGSYKKDWAEVASQNIEACGTKNHDLFHVECQDNNAHLIFDFVHIDGPHYYDWTTHCLENAKLCKAILMDDYLNCPDDRKATDDFAKKYADRVKEKIVIDSLRGDCLLLMK